MTTKRGGESEKGPYSFQLLLPNRATASKRTLLSSVHVRIAAELFKVAKVPIRASADELLYSALRLFKSR